MAIEFSNILTIAQERKGGPQALADLLGDAPDTPIAADDRILSSMGQHIMSAGFQWRVVQIKWPDHETVFGGFDVDHVAAMDAETLGTIAQDPRVIRHRAKILAIHHNAVWMQAMAAEHGSFGAWIDAWPSDDLVGLHQALKKQGKRLGGATGWRMLRSVGKDTFIPTQSVVQALVNAGVVTKAVSSKRDQRAMQDAFNQWRAETGRSFTHLSRILAYSVP
jgi:3-methyladenine DNA glycosylase Tag